MDDMRPLATLFPPPLIVPAGRGRERGRERKREKREIYVITAQDRKDTTHQLCRSAAHPKSQHGNEYAPAIITEYEIKLVFLI